MAKQDLVPIKVKIRYGFREGKVQHLFPDFNKIDSAIRRDIDWSYYIDAFGTGWHYDHFSGIGETDVVNPDPDIWYGCICVPKDFADAAVTLFPNDVEQVNELDWEQFYNDRAHAHEPEIHVDQAEIQAIASRVQLGNLQKTDKEYTDALDPDNPKPGLTRNRNKTWEQYKQKCSITIHPSKKKP